MLGRGIAVNRVGSGHQGLPQTVGGIQHCPPEIRLVPPRQAELHHLFAGQREVLHRLGIGRVAAQPVGGEEQRLQHLIGLHPGQARSELAFGNGAGESVEQCVHRLLVGFGHLQVAGVVHFVGDALRQQLAQHVGLMGIVEVSQLVHHRRQALVELRELLSQHRLHGLVHRLLVALTHNQRRTQPGVLQLLGSQRGLQATAGVVGPFVKLVGKLLVVWPTHLFGLLGLGGKRGHATLSALRHVVVVGGAALKAPNHAEHGLR